MPDNWSERERDTNRLVRMVAAWLFVQRRVNPDQLFGLVKLTWITASHVNDGTYIESVKIPAIGQILNQDYSKKSLAQVAADVSKRIGNAEVEALVLRETGFTNIYNAYRNSSYDWMRAHFRKILPLMKDAYDLRSDTQGRSLAKRIDALPHITKPGQGSSALHPANLLTPAMFALDKRIRFPILNGREHVRRILAKQGARNGTLVQKFDAMVSLYGKAGIRDAADLDQVIDELENFLGNEAAPPKKKILRRRRENGKHLPLKDESDLVVTQQERTAARKKLHNKMTNRLMGLWAGYTLTEGAGAWAQYDVMVKNYDGNGRDLIVEVKSSAETANLRMAVGQLFSYWYRLNHKKEYDLCILVPERPIRSDAKWLEWLGIGLIWFSDDTLETDCVWLAHLV